VYDLTLTDAFKIGLWQTLSLIPGVSRSGSTIVGGMLLGASRSVAAEFSFFLSFPIILAASGLKALKLIFLEIRVSTEELLLLLIGMAVSFLVSLAVIKFLMSFTKRHTLTVFGIYRIVLGGLVLLLCV
jgi:undecaprenyl-diphosphatase